MIATCETKDTSNSIVVCNKGNIVLTKNKLDDRYEVRLNVKSNADLTDYINLDFYELIMKLNGDILDDIKIEKIGTNKANVLYLFKPMIEGMGIAKRFIYSQIQMEKFGNKVMFKSQNLNYDMKDENYKQLIDEGSLLFIEIVNDNELNIVYSFSIDLGEVLPKYLENYIGVLIKKLFYRVKMHFNNI